MMWLLMQRPMQSAAFLIRLVHLQLRRETGLSLSRSTSQATISESGDSVEFTVTPTGVVSELSLSAHAHQLTMMGEMRMATLASDASTLALPLDGLAPGEVMVMGLAQSNGMLDYNFMLDFGLNKPSAPPVIDVDVNLDGSNATWDARLPQISQLLERFWIQMVKTWR